MSDDAVEAVRAAAAADATEALAIHRLRRQNRELRSRQKSLLAQLAAAEERFETLAEIKQPQEVPAIVSRTDAKREATAVLMASDWHVEERVSPETVNGKNTYNPAIAAARAERFFQGCSWLLNSFGRVTLRDGILWLGGDIISGYIHEELVESNYLSPTEAVLLAQRLIVAGIDFLLEDSPLERILVVCNYGNHGRTTHRRRVSTGAANSFEWLMYQVLAAHYRSNDAVTFLVAEGGHAYVDVYGFTVRFLHGDDVRYYGGVGGISVPMRKAVDAWNQTRHADYNVMGHYHQLRDYGDCVVNGSLIGWNAYAQSVKARYEPARQGFFLIDRKRGKTLFSPIWVED